MAGTGASLLLLVTTSQVRFILDHGEILWTGNRNSLTSCTWVAGEGMKKAKNIAISLI